MKNPSKKRDPEDKEKLIREKTHITTPPRLEGKVKNARMNPIKKKKMT